MAEAPNRYDDPYWSQLAAQAESRNGVPAGVVQSLVTHGERSNNDQVSSAGARTPFQIIPSTRDAFLKKYGVDAYLSPENAANVAALHIKESLDRGASVPRAVAEYNGGTDPARWDKTVPSYVQRVLSGMSAVRGSQAAGARSDATQSTFQTVLQEQKPQATGQLSQIYDAYKTGRMSAEDAAQFEADVNAGTVMLPRGAQLNTAAPKASGELPQGVLKAYKEGRMLREDMIDLERDVAGGMWTLPKGEKLGKTDTRGIIGGIAEAVTGAERSTDTSRSLPSYTQMPEWTNPSFKRALAGLGSLTSAPQEIAKIMQSQFPQIKLSQDEKGNPIMRSPTDSKDYVVPPGAEAYDGLRAAAAILAFTPAGRATTITGSTLANAGTAAALEGVKGAAGGDMSAGNVALAGGIGAAVPAVARAVQAIRNPAQAVIEQAAPVTSVVENPAAAQVFRSNRTGNPVTIENGVVVDVAPNAGRRATDIPSGAPQAAPASESVLRGASPIASPQPAVTDLAQTAKQAAQGSSAATDRLALAASPDAKVVDAAKRLGIEQHLQPDHVSTSRAYRDLAQAIKSMPGSQAAEIEARGYAAIGKKSDELIEKIGGTTDVSALDASVKTELQATHDRLKSAAQSIFKEIEKKVENTGTRIDPTNTLAVLNARIQKLGGVENLAAGEKKILDTFSGKNPTYGFVDETRKATGAAKRGANDAFGTRDAKILGDLETALRADQKAAAEAAGLGAKFEVAQGLAKQYKGLQDDMASLFAKIIDGSLVNGLASSVKALPSGDASKFIKFIKLIPENMREEVAATGLNTAFGKAARNQSLDFTKYANWYKGLLANKQAYHALMTNLPAGSAKQLSDLYRVSNGISQSKAVKVPTGRILAVLEDGADGLMSKIYSVAKRSVGIASAELATSAVGLHGVGLASGITSALMKTKPKALQAADALISSPEFMRAAMAPSPEAKAKAVKVLANSRPMLRFFKAAGSPREMADRERWIMNALETGNAEREKK